MKKLVKNISTGEESYLEIDEVLPTIKPREEEVDEETEFAMAVSAAVSFEDLKKILLERNKGR